MDHGFGFFELKCFLLGTFANDHRIVTPDLGKLATDGFDLGQLNLFLRRCRARGCGSSTERAHTLPGFGSWAGDLGDLRHAGEHVVEGLRAGGAAKDRIADLGADIRHELLEINIGLTLVFVERVLLAVAAQVDAPAKLLHLG